MILRLDSPNPHLELLHEIHHLYKPIVVPFWSAQLDKDYILHKLTEDEKVREEAISILENIIINRKKLEAVKFTFLAQALGKIDNIIEDNRIAKHLKLHKISDEEILQLHGENSAKIYEGIKIISEKAGELFGDFGNLLLQIGKMLKKLKTWRDKVWWFYFTLDVVTSYALNKPILDYFDSNIETLMMIGSKLKEKGIICYIGNNKLKEERKRIAYFRKMFEDYEFRESLVLFLSEFMPKNTYNKLARFLQVNGRIFTKGFRWLPVLISLKEFEETN